MRFIPYIAAAVVALPSAAHAQDSVMARDTVSAGLMQPKCQYSAGRPDRLEAARISGVNYNFLEGIPFFRPTHIGPIGAGKNIEMVAGYYTGDVQIYRGDDQKLRVRGSYNPLNDSTNVLGRVLDIFDHNCDRVITPSEESGTLEGFTDYLNRKIPEKKPVSRTR